MAPKSTRAPADGGFREPVVAVVIPAFQAEKHIQQVICSVPDFVRHIVVVDDASTDRTADRVACLGHPQVHLVQHQRNQGVGAAVLTGYEKSLSLGAEIVAKMDADDQMDPAYLRALIEPLVRGEADYTKGNRFLHFRQLGKMRLLRRVGNMGLSFLTKLASGYWNIFDPANGYTAIHASLIPWLSKERIAKRYFFETSMLLELSLMRAVVRDVPVPARYADELSRLSEFRTLLEFPPRLVQRMVLRILLQYFLRDFTACSLFLVMGLVLTAFGTAWGLYHWYLSVLTALPATTGTVMLAVLPIILGIQFLLQAAALDIQGVPHQPLQLGVFPSDHDKKKE
jgi:dolichol-phosphate mannosyltransferase